MRSHQISTVLLAVTATVACGPADRTARDSAPDTSEQEIPRGSDTHPEWSPDGLSMAFISNREGVQAGRPINFEVYRAAVDGSNEERLTHNRDFEADVAWSADGESILFKSFRDGNDEIYLMDENGREQRNLTNSPASDGGPSWSPDGSTILFDSDRAGEERRLFLMNADGSNVRLFPNDPGPGHSARYSPDGTLVAFVSGRDGNGEIYVMNTNGSNVRRLTVDPRENGYPRWRPDGTAIAHTAGSFETDRWEVVLTDLSGSDSRVLVDSTDSGNVAWSPDGSQLLFGRYRIYGESGGDESQLHILDLASRRLTPIYRGGTQ